MNFARCHTLSFCSTYPFCLMRIIRVFSQENIFLSQITFGHDFSMWRAGTREPALAAARGLGGGRRPALASDGKGGGVAMVRPLSDPIGGTDRNNGRHPAKMHEPKAAQRLSILEVWGCPDLACTKRSRPEVAMRAAAAPDGEDIPMLSPMV